MLGLRLPDDRAVRRRRWCLRAVPSDVDTQCPDRRGRVVKRLLALPVLFAAGVAYGYWSGLLWPLATTVVRPLLRPALPETEADFLA